jgi:hypothetical protein
MESTLPNDLPKKILHYWQRTLIDGPYMNIPSKTLEKAFEISISEVKNGKIQTLLIELEDSEALEGEDMEQEEKGYLICPIVFYLDEDSAGIESNLPGVITPFWIPALIKDGELTPKRYANPWIPREYLDPTFHEQSIGSFTDFESNLLNNKLPLDVHSWETVWEYSCELFNSVTKQSIEDFSITGYKKHSHAILVQESRSSGHRNITKLYRYFENIDLPPLLKRFANPVKENILPLQSENILLASHHVGQMSNEHPLSHSQRQTVHHFQTAKEGEVLAVNGPPGTGKTTLLQTILANLLVEKAYKGEDPPIILVSSTNNQAVTNVIDSMGNVKEIMENDNAERQRKLKNLEGRWLPNLTSYGLYCPSNSKAKEAERENKPWLLLKDDGSGFHKNYENSELLQDKIAYFLERCSLCAESEIKDVEEAVEWLQGELRKTVDQISIGFQQWSEYYQLKTELIMLNINENEIDKNLISLKESLKLTEEEKEAYDFLSARSKKVHSIWMKLFSFVPAVKIKNQRRMKDFLYQNMAAISLEHYDIASVESWFNEKNYYLESLIHDKRNIVKKVERYIKLEGLIKDWCLATGCSVEYKTAVEQVDKTLRYFAFKWAVHYWEGRWLLDVKKGIEDNKSEIKLKRKWLRYATLTPCVVATFYMTPKLFSAWQGKDIPLLNFLDLLIVDEAGQVLPEVAAPTFGFAKKALVVGDTLQIEPIWNVDQRMDKFNLQTLQFNEM